MKRSIYHRRKTRKNSHSITRKRSCGGMKRKRSSIIKTLNSLKRDILSKSTIDMLLREDLTKLKRHQEGDGQGNEYGYIEPHIIDTVIQFKELSKK